MTNAKEHDRNQLEILVDDKEAMYVFDRAYVDYKRFDLFTDDGIFFVCRLKKNAVITIVEEFKVPKVSNIISDKMVFIESSSNCTENVYRVIVILDEKRKLVKFTVRVGQLSCFSSGSNNM